MKTSNTKDNQVFISYAHEDKDTVEKIHHGLKVNNVNTWWDETSLSEENIEREILREIDFSRFFLFCLSKNSFNKISRTDVGYVGHELNVALNATLTRADCEYEILLLHLENMQNDGSRISTGSEFYLSDGLDACVGEIYSHIKARLTTHQLSEVSLRCHNLLQQATLKHFCGDSQNALEILEDAFAIEPKNHAAWNMKGAVYNDLKRHEDAVICFEMALKMTPETYEPLNNLGVSYLRLKRYKKAVRVLEKAISTLETAHDSWVNIAYAYFALGEINQAFTVIERGLRTVPDDLGKSSLWNVKGCIMLYQNDRDALDNAEEAFENALELDSGNSEAQENLNTVYSRRMNNQTASRFNRY